jgi:hypothetical protein
VEGLGETNVLEAVQVAGIRAGDGMRLYLTFEVGYVDSIDSFARRSVSCSMCAVERLAVKVGSIVLRCYTSS